EDRLAVLLAAKDDRIANATEQSQRLYDLFQIVGVVGGVALLIFTVRDMLSRSRENSRQRTIDEIVKDAMVLQKSATAKQLELLDIRIGAEKGDVSRAADTF